MRSIENCLKMALVVLVLSLATRAWSEEGMWTYDNFPSAEVKRRYGFEPTAAWLEHVRLASAKLAQGCSGSFVSSAGLVLTNHHCVSRCLEQLSNEREDRLSRGFYAQQENDELRCPASEIDQLLQISDVTDRVNRVTRGLSGARLDRKSTRLNSSHPSISYAVFCLKKKKKNNNQTKTIKIKKKKKHKKN